LLFIEISCAMAMRATTWFVLCTCIFYCNVLLLDQIYCYGTYLRSLKMRRRSSEIVNLVYMNEHRILGADGHDCNFVVDFLPFMTYMYM